MKINELSKRYLSYIKRQHSMGTYRFYENHLGHFCKWCELREVETTQDLHYFIFDDYIANMKETCANITINKRIGILKRMFKYHEINLPYLQKIGKLRERVHTYDMIELNDLMNIRSYVKQLPNNGNNLLYKVLILLLMDTGARINEILNIRKTNVNLVDCEILLTETKTKEDRVVYFQRTSMSYVKKMLDIENDHGYLLHNILKNRHSNYFDVDNYMRKLKKILSIKKLHAHMFRHSFATLWLQEGADINSVMKVMGHKNMETTQRYQHSNRKHIKTMYQKYKLDED